MRKIISFILGSIFALNLMVSSAFSAANEVRIAFFLEWATPNQEAKVKKTFDKAFGVPVKWTNFATGGEMTEAMLSGDIDISYSQGLTPFVNAVNAVCKRKGSYLVRGLKRLVQLRIQTCPKLKMNSSSSG